MNARLAAGVAALLALAGCVTSPDGAPATSPACDAALERMNGWAQGLLPPIPDAEQAELQRLAQAVEQTCAAPAAASSGLDRADAALAAAYAMQRRFPAALETLQGADEQDSPEALMVLANLVGQGAGTDKDPARAARLLERAASVGGAEFQIRAAQEFLAGASVERDPARARALYQRALDQGSAEALLAYATDYLGLFRSNTPEAAVEQALALVRRAAEEQNSGRAMAMLAGFYLSERGRDLAAAASWAERALASGDKSGPRAKGLVAFTRFRQSVAGRADSADADYSAAPDGVAAADWFRKGAEGGDAQSAAYLGELYAIGVGVERDRDAALRWLRQARAGGSRQGAALLRRLGAGAEPAS